MAEDNLRENESEQSIKVDTVELAGTLTNWSDEITGPFRREMAAKWIAQTIVFIAGGSIGVILLLGFILIFLLKNKPEDAKQLIVGAVVPLLEKAATFFTTVFSPLLAFILGYYFGHRQAQHRAGDK